MKQLSVTSGFTLVELIVVITILAILGTIAFVSLWWYSSDARNTKRTSDLASIQSALTTSITQWVSILSFATNDNSWDSRVSTISIGWTSPSVGTEYEAGHINYTALWLKPGDFTDPSSNTPYTLGVTIKSGWKYEVAATLEKESLKMAKIVGDYNPRGVTWIAGSWVSSSTLFVIWSTADINKFMIGDTVNGGRTITSISSSWLSITVNSAFTGAQTQITLDAAESAGLIDKFDTPALSGTGIITESSTASLPYTY